MHAPTARRTQPSPHTIPATVAALVISILAAKTTAQSPQHLVVPAAYEHTDAISYQWIAGASRAVRQQTLIGAGSLQTLVGHSLTAIELRRSAKNETFAGGVANLTVTLSISPHDPLNITRAFAGNVGVAPQQVFSGAVQFPTSPPNPGPNVAWTPDNVVRIAFATPFVYGGGTLCLDVVGTPIAGQEAAWWMADAMFEDVEGSATDLGGGCGGFGGPQHTWSHVATRTLVAGNYADFFAYGTPWSLAVAAFGLGNPTGLPVHALGLPSPIDCELHLSTIDGLMPAVLVPHTDPMLQSRGGLAHIELKLPGAAQALGMQLTTQWLEWEQMATSNALQWTVCGALPTLDMALVEGDPSEAEGQVSVHLAHVLRFEFE
ncbi:MAG: hypothetical protein H6835_05185 [Planctomycetes bacterium]|nr:hypothetical protein [Planctomycetota bacterium]